MVFALFAVSCASEAAVTTTTTTAATTTPTTSTTTTTVPETTTTTVSEDQRIAEVTEIVRQTAFKWFEAIFKKDVEALGNVVAVQDRVDTAVDAMDNGSYFIQAPTLQDVAIEVLEILVDRPDCLAVSYQANAEAFRGEGAVTIRTEVFWPRPLDGEWRRAYLGDEWQAACDEFSREGQLP